jgi:hypothetical protein
MIIAESFANFNQSKIRPKRTDFVGFLLKLHFDFSVNTSWQAQVLKRVNSFWCSVADINQAFVHAHFK